jgi:6-phosphogluconolactonase
MSSQPEIRTWESEHELFRTAAGEFSTLASAAVSARGKFTVALSGGSTPKGLYSLLARMPSLPWDKVLFFWGDERHMPPDHPESNYRMAQAAMLLIISAIPENIFRIPAEEKDAERAARAYQQTIERVFQLTPGEFPRFDLILLGIGPDGHTASLFPGTKALEESRRFVVANWMDKFNAYRITMTFPVLNHAACVMFLVSGTDKSEIIHEILENPQAHLPAQNIHPVDGRLVWLLDGAAAAKLSTIDKNR